MQSQILQTSSQIQFRMPLSKFSSATTSHGYGGPIPWTHLTSENALYATFETPPPGSYSTMVPYLYRFKVSNNPDVLVMVCVEQGDRSADSSRRISTLMPWVMQLESQPRMLHNLEYQTRVQKSTLSLNAPALP